MGGTSQRSESGFCFRFPSCDLRAGLWLVLGLEPDPLGTVTPASPPPRLCCLAHSLPLALFSCRRIYLSLLGCQPQLKAHSL